MFRKTPENIYEERECLVLKEDKKNKNHFVVVVIGVCTARCRAGEEVGAPLQDEITGLIGPLIASHSGAKVSSRNWQTFSSSIKMKVLAPKTLPREMISCWQAKASTTPLCSKRIVPE